MPNDDHLETKKAVQASRHAAVAKAMEGLLMGLAGEGFSVACFIQSPSGDGGHRNTQIIRRPEATKINTSCPTVLDKVQAFVEGWAAIMPTSQVPEGLLPWLKRVRDSVEGRPGMRVELQTEPVFMATELLLVALEDGPIFDGNTEAALVGPDGEMYTTGKTEQ